MIKLEDLIDAVKVKEADKQKKKILWILAIIGAIAAIAGIAYAINQIVDLLANGVDGIHLYTMNNPYVAKHIYDAVASLLK